LNVLSDLNGLNTLNVPEGGVIQLGGKQRGEPQIRAAKSDEPNV
jgi:hypothetical protein